ncbi:MAG: GNAT family N-acetyltransferase [Pseudomonadota bacterium]
MDHALRPLAEGDDAWIIARHADHYARVEGFDASFPVLVARILQDFHNAHVPLRERGWMAVDAQGTRLGSIFCVTEAAATPEIAKLRLFYVEPAARGSGLAQALLEACLGFARGAGYRHMRLWTHESHSAAGRLYARNGFALTHSHATRSFGQDVVEQVWERAL